MLLFLVTIALIIAVIGLACYQVVLENRIKILETKIRELEEVGRYV